MGGLSTTECTYLPTYLHYLARVPKALMVHPRPHSETAGKKTAE